MKRLIKTLLGKLPYIKELYQKFQKQGAYPAGHYYSPIPDKDEVLAYIDSKKPLRRELPGVNLNEENQLKLLHEYSQYYEELPFPEKQKQGCRYYYENSWYSYSDAIFLYGFLRKHKPKSIIEIGSGFSSAVILDTTERFFSQRPEITFIEPYPDRLKSLFKSHDESQVRMIEKKVQEVPPELFSSLESGDFLFIEDAGAGRDDLPGGSAESHYNSLQKLKDLPGDLMVYPAHEYRERKPSNLDQQRLKNPHMQLKTKQGYMDYIEALKLGPADWMKDVLAANYKCSRDPNAVWIPTDVPACEVKGTMNPNAGDIDVHYVCNDTMKVAVEEGALLIDVREPYELDDQLGHIEGVMNIPVGQVSHSMDKLAEYKDQPIVMVCRSGARATTAAQILITGGFGDVVVLEGGMLGYRRG